MSDLDPLGRRRSPVTLPEYRKGRKPANAGRKFPAEPLTAEEVVALLDAAGGGAAGDRDRALIVVLWRTGLRIAEALALEPKDVSLQAGTITVLHGKGDRRRVVGIDETATRYVAQWMAARQTLNVPPRSPLFCCTRNDGGDVGRRVQSSAVREKLKRCARKAGIEKRVHPHGLRHTHAFDLVTEGVPVHIVRAQLGHVDLHMTQRYIDHLAPAALVQALRERQWPEHLLPTDLIPTPDSDTFAALSQGERAPGSPDPSHAPEPAPKPVPAPQVSNPNAKSMQRVLNIMAEAGGRTNQTTVAEALGITRHRAGRLMRSLEELGMIVSAGYQREGNRVTHGWRLAPPKARFTALPVQDPRLSLGPIAKRGFGPQRVLDTLVDLGGKATQADLARELGVTSRTVAHHCAALARDGKVRRGGLDKTHSNRGSQIWIIPQTPTPPPAMASGWRTLRIAVPGGRESRAATG